MSDETNEKQSKRGSITADPELKAMAQISKILSGIDDERARARVVRWANERYSNPANPSEPGQCYPPM